MDYAIELAGASSAEICEIVDIWLWGFSEPEHWPSLDEAQQMLDTLTHLPNADDKGVRDAIANCSDYIATYPSSESNISS
ncbi:hypothetical protein DIE23_14040 [Burkholderia sp. Bp9143]|uniref:hypothetical protein n=1 Tax=Burkholderia sp. Bp9143 TaxID=2184574 RepID=UPI000F5B0404|nr:hypothetical protein [Burkholderia sp. Bp9143]RQR33862.1 hypothetical protein DIE23_14040 [Burkholderia sp. Bp9143]